MLSGRASDRAYETLRREILQWRLAPGTVLGEVEQSTRLGISRTPLREALSRLTADGLVEAQSGRGLVVAQVSPAAVSELFELREALETAASALASERRDPGEFARLADDFDGAAALVEQGELEAYYALVERFDDAIDESLGNPYLVGALRGVRTHLQRIRRLSQDDPARLVRAAAEHRTIAEAIRDGDAELARSATRIHLRASLRHIQANPRLEASEPKESA
ncbi:GntR family transcriptional regulator [Protaetiibacter mangrovi]|uniref:GntR family transcriptional regulator n=1 Tax=Protaetiibacter mangrovi TaxID=2970926 RepID=A0ABT1ZIS5_9MICO|nr:GntR family transcriptional regulator [Protaetiibacter mangrovi]MCS0500614.1 GntR family transcriptional regulator [Protaetiibacter mangrovi]TPX04372.1 GntR family transcriptional regulator [Schumannella luteola]